MEQSRSRTVPPSQRDLQLLALASTWCGTGRGKASMAEPQQYFLLKQSHSGSMAMAGEVAPYVGWGPNKPASWSQIRPSSSSRGPMCTCSENHKLGSGPASALSRVALASTAPHAGARQGSRPSQSPASSTSNAPLASPSPPSLPATSGEGTPQPVLPPSPTFPPSVGATWLMMDVA